MPRNLWDKVQAKLNSNLQTCRKRVREQGSSLLTGLVEDGNGNRFTPSFTIKRGRRYRYYVSQLAIKNPGRRGNGQTRVPAHELESRVTEKLLAFLKSDAEVFDTLSSKGESPATGRNLVAAAKKLAIRMSSLPAAELRDLLAAFLRRVVVGEDQIEVRLDAEELRRLLENGDTSTTQNLASVRKPVALNNLITLTIEAKQKRFGGEVHLIVPPNSSPSVGQPKPH